MSEEKKTFFKCTMCTEKAKHFPYYERDWVLAHFFDEHRANLSFMSDDEILESVIVEIADGEEST